MTKVYLLTHLAVFALGYFGRMFVESSQRRRRERVLRALGGDLPDWEHNARALEADVQHQLLAMTDVSDAVRVARLLREEADITRQRGRRRDREWS